MPGAPPDPGGGRPADGPPPEQRAAMRNAVQDVMRKVQADRKAEMAQALAQHAKSRRRQARGGMLVAVAALLLAAAAWWALPRWQHPFPPREGQAAERDARSAILLVAKVVDNFRAQHRRLPRSLRETGVVLPGVGYTEDGARYTLSATAAGHTVTFVSTEDKEKFARGQ